MSIFEITNKSLFIACLAVSFTVWLLNALSEQHPTELEVQLQYVNLPNDKVAATPLTENLKLSVFAPGFNLLRYNIFNNPQRLLIDYERYEKANLIPSDQLILPLNEQLKMNIVDIQPEFLNLNFEEKLSKKVPIQIPYNLTFASSHFLAGDIQIFPSEVNVIGPRSNIRDIEYWETDSLILKDVTTAQKGELKLRPPQNFNVSLEPALCNYEFEVDNWTEKQLEIPIEVINLPDSLFVYLAPKIATVSLQIPMSAYETYIPDLFQVVADYEELTPEKDQILILPLQLQTQLKEIQRTSVQPETVKCVFYR